MKTERWWMNGVLTREVKDGIEISDNVGKTYLELGITPPKQVQKSIRIMPVFKPTPYDQWPIWAKALKLLATPEDKGIGDVVARTIGPENSEVFKTWYKKTTGKNCGCTGRQARWNQIYPLPPQ